MGTEWPEDAELGALGDEKGKKEWVLCELLAGHKCLQVGSRGLGKGACDVFGGKKETGSGLQNQIGEGDPLLKEQREWMMASECGKCRCGWGKSIYKGEAGAVER